MSGVLFLVVLCLVMAYILYDNSQRNRRLAQARNKSNPSLKGQVPPNQAGTSSSSSGPASLLRRNQDYLNQAKILTEMAKQKLDPPVSSSSKSVSLPKISVHWRADNPVSPALMEMFRKADESYNLHLVISLREDQQHSATVQALSQVVKPKKTFSCKTQEGLHAVIRQLGARVHVESDLSVIKSLKSYLHTVATVGTTIQEDVSVLKNSANVVSLQSLEEIFGNLDKLIV